MGLLNQPDPAVGGHLGKDGVFDLVFMGGSTAKIAHIPGGETDGGKPGGAVERVHEVAEREGGTQVIPGGEVPFRGVQKGPQTAGRTDGVGAVRGQGPIQG